MGKKTGDFSKVIIVCIIVNFILIGCQTKISDNIEKEIAVEVMEIKNQAISKNIILNAHLEPKENAIILPKTLGINVANIGVNVGDRVSKGDFLFELDKTMLRKQIEQTKAAYDIARKNYEQQSILAVATNQLDQTRMAYSAALSQLEEMEYYSPINGYISQVNINENQPVLSTQPALIITNIEKLKASIHVSKSLYEYLEEGQNVLVNIDNTKTSGKIRTLSPIPDLASNLYLVEIEVLNNENKSWVGTFSNILIELDKKDEVTVIPKSAILEDNEGKYVFVEKDSRVYRRQIDVGIDDGGQVEVVSGLNIGEKIVTKGQQFVKDKGLVIIVRGDENENL